jgi:hypothetical protein
MRKISKELAIALDNCDFSGLSETESETYDNITEKLYFDFETSEMAYCDFSGEMTICVKAYTQDEIFDGVSIGVFNTEELND